MDGYGEWWTTTTAGGQHVLDFQNLLIVKESNHSVARRAFPIHSLHRNKRPRAMQETRRGRRRSKRRRIIIAITRITCSEDKSRIPFHTTLRTTNTFPLTLGAWDQMLRSLRHDLPQHVFPEGAAVAVERHGLGGDVVRVRQEGRICQDAVLGPEKGYT